MIKIIRKLTEGLGALTALTIALLVSGIILRFFETLLLSASWGSFSTQFSLNLYGILYDLKTFLEWSWIALIAYLLLHFLNKKLARRLFLSLSATALFLSLGMVSYFATAAIPLDKAFFTYSLSEVYHITLSSNNTPLWAYLFYIAIPLLLYLVASRIKTRSMLLTFLFLVIILIGSAGVLPEISFDSAKTELQRNTIKNKFQYFTKSTFEYFNYKNAALSDTELPDEIETFQKTFDEFEFVDKKYPFLHKDKTANTLGPFFQLDPERKPNLVFIIVESLGRSYSGPNSDLTSLTPFLDSLAQHSLYWENCLSTTQRTFGVLPTIFGSLPYGREGFMAYGKSIPEHNTLIQTLQNNHYASSFLYGGWLDFDKMQDFFNYQQLDHFISDWGDNQKTSDQKGFSWGYDDKTAFKQGIKSLNFNQSPRLDIYLTLSSHAPWAYPNKAGYVNKLESLLAKRQMDSEKKAHLLNFKEEFAAFLYTDDAIRQIMLDYQKKPGFENTIFVITGDHRMYLSPRQPIDKYHVPFMIYSPLLTQSRSFPAVVSHRNVSPSLLALLKTPYAVKSSKQVTWLAKALDTCSHFRSRGFSPFMLTSRSIKEFRYRDYFISSDTVYRINAGMKLEQETHPDSVQMLQTILKNYVALDRYVCDRDALIPSRFDKRSMQVVPVVQKTDNFESREGDYNIAWKRLAPRPDKHGQALHFPKEIAYPIAFLRTELKDDYESIQLDYSFDLMLEDGYQPKKLFLVYEITRDKKTIYWEKFEYGGPWYGEFGKWKSVHETVLMKKKNYQYQEGDLMKVYLWNSEKLPFYLDNLSVNLSKIIY